VSTARRTTLATSWPLRQWLRNDPAWPAQPLAWRAQQTWLAALGSLNRRLSEATQAQSALLELQDPVFVVGPWRSGTTVMHELLVAATGCATPRTWQCMDPCAFRLPRRERKPAAVARPMDGLEIRDDSPQEDEFALLALGVDSAYRAFWMPHRLPELQHTLDPDHWLAHPQWLAPWEAFLRGVLATQGNADPQPLILKSPNHTYRIASILQRFPRARFVWMLRDPVQVFHSNRKMWGEMFAMHGLGAVQTGALDVFLVQAMQATERGLRTALDRSDHDRWACVSHDALRERPMAVVEQIVDRLRLPRALQRDALPATLDRVRRGRVEAYARPLPAAAEAACIDLGNLHRMAANSGLVVT
jgi:hypothetical protein